MMINEATGVTPSQQVASALRDEIAAGRLAIGERIPATRELAERFGVALTTAVRAVEQLRDEGLLETRRGRGSYVRRRPELFRRGDNRYRRNPEGLSPNRSESAEGGWTDEVDSKRWRENATAEIATRLDIAEGDPVTVARYRWTVDGEPIQVGTQWEPLKLTAGTPIEEPVDGTRGNPGVLQRFDSIGLYVDQVTEETRTRMPTSSESELLHLSAGIPIFDIRRTHWAGDTPVETASIAIRGDRMVITTTHDVPLPDES